MEKQAKERKTALCVPQKENTKKQSNPMKLLFPETMYSKNSLIS